MRSKQEIRQVVLDLIAEFERGGDVELLSESPLGAGGLELTSLDLVRLLVGLEQQLGIELDDGAIMNSSFDVVDDIVSLVVRSAPEAAFA